MKTIPVSAVMTADPITVGPRTSFKDIAGLLTAHGISAVGVVDKTGALLGVISEADLLPHLQHARAHRWPHRQLIGKAHACLAQDLMTAPAVTVDADDPVEVAVARIGRSGVRRMFVLCRGKLVGVVARRDLIRVFTRSDAELEREVDHRVLRDRLHLGPDRVQVRDGVVTVVGRVERRSDIPPVTQLIEDVSGVVEARNRLDYVWDDVGPGRSGAGSRHRRLLESS
ncbi:CBS domain-containing protein [Amycolatopsis sp. PS_44_ISF1]|uniref:CBS domain-containing protein n=1 Tax=Amycolatopsis sp. PS_44_ISF1 TaxID=2974917 RepID=UPI0028DDBD6B|nr:CBS domain-containing protein [Amycolatopsis sp. PS_44_ISF1]MDT8912398.1 CBS domain-containing protein [Amycolatopsis sp. PS_44_ISF1]